MEPLEGVELAVNHEALREAILETTLSDLTHQLQHAMDDSDHEWADEIRDKIQFVQQSVLADYVVGVMYVDVGGERDYHNVIRTDNGCSLHRAVGLSQITTDFLRDV